MSDFGPPPTANYTAPDGLATIGSLMSLKAQKQQLQSQALTIQGQQQGLQGQAAQVQMTQQDAAQRKSLANIDWDKHLDSDGLLDTTSFAKDPGIRKAAGDQYPDLLAKANQVRQGQIANQQSLLGLNKDQIGAVGSMVDGLRTDPDVVADNAAGRQKVTNAFAQAGQVYGPGVAKVAATYGPMVQHAPPGKLPGALQALALQTESAGKQIDITTPGGASVQGKNGLNIINTNPNAAQPVGAQVGQTITDQGLSPTQTPGYAGAVASASSRGSGVASSDIDRANQVSANIQPSRAAITTTQKIDDLADQIRSGKYSKFVTDQAAAAGSKDPAVTARQLLEKDLGQVKNLAGAGAASDQKLQTVLSGYPDATSTPETIHTAMDYIRGAFRQNVARGDQLNKYREKDPDLKGFQHADDVLSTSKDPLMHEFSALKTPAERIGFYKRNFTSPQDAQAFKDKVAGINHVVGQ